MKKNNKVLLIFFLVFINISYSQTYFINVRKLNIRENPDKNSNVIGSYSKNDTVNILSQQGDWYKVENKKKIGFINKKYLSSKKEENKIEKGFISGFNKVFLKSLIITGLVFFLYQSYKRRIADSRYKKGYRQGNISIREYIAYGSYSLIISLIIGVVNGVASWLEKF
ncbi:MAG: SH3 domain-containing protein [Flavobacteriaceae bacterium]|nr:SH3 domain-containing protein [Flavobacteriaceae bacterium]